MLKQEPWAEHFKIDASRLEAWRKSAIPGEDVLHFALRTNQLDQGAYLQWASVKWELPYLSPLYLEAGPDVALWERSKGLAPWASNLLPLHEWDGTLLIGCERRPESFPLRAPHLFVLASASHLQELWMRLNSAAPAAKTEPNFDAPDGLSPETPIDPSSLGDVTFNFGALTQAQPGKSRPPATSAVPEQVHRPFPKRDRGISKNGADAEPIELTNVTRTGSNSTDGDTQPGVFLETCTTYEQVAASAFRLAVPPYQRAMMLVFQGGQLKPWKWTQEFHPKKDRPDSIDLEPTSAFRIVYNTLLPYHGRLVPNDVNSRFFDDVDRGRMPAHLTIVPVLIERQVAGMLLAATDAELNQESSLLLMENVADEVGRALRRIRGDRLAA